MQAVFKPVVIRLCVTGFVLSAFASVGCQSAPPAVAADVYTDYPKVTATGGMNSILRVREAGVSIENSDVYRVSIPVRNIATQTKLVQYRYFFFDANGRMHNTDPAWKRARIAPDVEVFMVGNSIRPAEDFRLEIRPQR